MKLIQKTFFLVLFCFFLFKGCSSESSSQKKDQQKVVFGKVELTEGWARPGAKGQTSGIYLTINNGTASTDTLIGVTSEVAEKAEVHETIQNKDGTMSMRPVGQPTIKESSTLRLQPGGKHIMLMNLKRDLVIGDSLSVSLDFAHVGKKTILVPVKIQN